MNYLAHLLLSGPDEDTRLGGLIGDFMRGHELDDFAPGIRAGILRHRLVDRLTDAHPVFRRSRGRMPPHAKRFAGVVVDVAYDHLLAAGWSRWQPHGTLRDFADAVYRSLERRRSDLPPRLQHALPWIVGEDWLASYADLDHVARAFAGMSRRLRRDNPLARGADWLRASYAELAADFAEFFPALRAAVDETGGGRAPASGHPRTGSTR